MADADDLATHPGELDAADDLTLFDGIEDDVPVADGGTDGPAVSTAAAIPGVTVAELHSLALGCGPALLVMLGAPQLWPLILGLYGAAYLGNSERLGGLPLTERVTQYVAREPWWLAGGTTLGTLTGVAIDATIAAV